MKPGAIGGWKAILLVLGLTGCASHYSVSESELSQHLNRHLRSETELSADRFLRATLTLSDIDVQIGRTPDRVTVTADSRLSVKTPLVPLKARVEFEFEARPWYDRGDHSVYLQELTLVRMEATPRQLEQLILPASQEAMRFVRLYLESQPVYRLDQKGWKEDLLRRFGKEIQIQPGRLEFVLRP
ncbi:DUF1439 domain-containing protein [Ferrimonas gelatinilytica]|uniref:DUF1439 domain-containing protein n=1 Tax=Ferrimonas gelatinilytica TaxID=1255257 RepID=A0ABP9SCW8_9GAMM